MAYKGVWGGGGFKKVTGFEPCKISKDVKDTSQSSTPFSRSVRNINRPLGAAQTDSVRWKKKPKKEIFVQTKPRRTRMHDASFVKSQNVVT